MATQDVKGRRRARRAKAGAAPYEATQPEAFGASAVSEARGDAQAPSDQGEADNPETPILGEAFQVSDEIRPVTSDRTAAWRKWKSSKKAKEQAAQSAVVLLTILDGAIGLALGPECQMTPDEQRMISEPLSRIMARMTPETTELIDKYTDPVLLVFGLMAWGGRVFFVLQRKAADEKPAVAPVVEEAPSMAPAPVGKMPVGVPDSISELIG